MPDDLEEEPRAARSAIVRPDKGAARSVRPPNGSEESEGLDEQIPGDAALSDEKALVEALVKRGRSARTIDLSREEEDSLSQRITRDFQDASANLQVWRENHTRYLENWRGVVAPKDFPFDGAANIMVPLTSSFVETWKARILKALFGSDMFARFSSVDGSQDEKTLDEINKWFQWELEEIVRIKECFYDITHDTVLHGLSLPFAEYTRKVELRSSSQDWEITEGEALSDQLTKHLGELFTNQQPDISSKGPGLYEVRHRSEDGERRTAKVAFFIDDDTERLVAEVEKEEIVFDGVQVHRVALEDTVVINSQRKLEDLPFFGSRWWLSWTDFVRGQTQGLYRRFDDEGMAELKKGLQIEKSDTQDQLKAGSGGKTESEIDMPISQLSDAEEGTNSEDIAGVDLARRFLEIYRWEGWWSRAEVEHPGEPTAGFSESPPDPPVQVAVWQDTQSKRIIRIEKLEALNKDGLRTPVKFDFIVDPDRFFSIGLAEWLQHVQEEVNGIHNQRLDAGLLTNVPFFLYEPAAGLQFDLIKVQPGTGIPVRSVQKVLFPQLRMQSFWSFQEEGNVWKLSQQQAGLGEPAQGSFTSKRTSASEFIGTQGAIDLRTELIVEGIFRSARTLLYRIFGLYQQHLRDGRVFQVTGINGEKEVRRLKRDRLQGKMSLHLTANIKQLSADLEQQTAMNMMSILLNPIFVQSGTVGPDTMFAALTKLMKVMGYTGVPIHEPDMPPESDPPEVEAKKMLEGVQVKPSPTERFNEHMQSHAQTMIDPAWLAVASLEAQQAMQTHMQETIKMQQLVQQLRAQQAMEAQAARGQMERMGIRPGMPGSSGSTEAQAGTEAEGVQPGA